MATVSDVIKVASSQIGVKESPAGSNNVKYNTEYYGHEVNGSKYAWCLVVQWWIFKHAGASDLFYDGDKIASCTAFCTWAQKNMKVVDKDKGQAGDIVILKFNNNKTHDDDHVGLIISKNVDGTYKTIEGNTSVTSDDNGGCVMERTRSQSVIHHIFRPAYDVASAKTTSTIASTTSSTSTSTATSKSASTTYTVKKGDTLSSIGAAYNVAWKDIANLNNIKSPYTIIVGQKIKLPSGASNNASKSYRAKVTAKSGLNIRKGAGESYAKSGSIPYNTTITITQEANGWGKTTYNKITGWVSLDYVKKC